MEAATKLAARQEPPCLATPLLRAKARGMAQHIGFPPELVDRGKLEADLDKENIVSSLSELAMMDPFQPEKGLS